jgi:NAD(P)-dependent dehydrogenase (short-subunit alcohol dehydrogenase family)
MSKDRYSIQGRVAIVTGGGTGIGKAICEAFAQAGARVVVVGRTEATLKAVAAEIGGLAHRCDVGDPQQVQALFTAVKTSHGRVDVLVNNAGLTGPIAPVAEADLAAWRRCFEVNVLGALHCLQQAAAIMTKQGSGSIINMASRMGLVGQPMRSAYCASKFALIGMTQSIAYELGPTGVRVNALCPGAVSGALMDEVVARRAQAEGRSPEAVIQESYTDVAALRRWVDPAEVAAAALFLASDASSAITGQSIPVDCGRF